MNKITFIAVCMISLIGFDCKADVLDLTLDKNFKENSKVIPVDIFGRTQFIHTNTTYEQALTADVNYSNGSPSSVSQYYRYYDPKRKNSFSDAIVFLDDFPRDPTVRTPRKKTYRISLTSKIDFKLQSWKPALEYRFSANDSRSLVLVFWDRHKTAPGVKSSRGPLLSFKIKF